MRGSAWRRIVKDVCGGKPVGLCGPVAAIAGVRDIATLDAHIIELLSLQRRIACTFA